MTRQGRRAAYGGNVTDPDTSGPDARALLNVPTDGPADARLTLFVRGQVQGVGFRWWTRARALELGLVGHARNTGDGRVEVVAQGRADALGTFEQRLQELPSTAGRPGRVDGVVVQWSSPKTGIIGFVER